MKKNILLVVGLLLAVVGNTQAAMNFYRADNGQLMLEATSCQDVARMEQLLALPDDPPTGEKEENTSPVHEEEPTENEPALVEDGSQKIFGAIWGQEEQRPTDKQSKFQDISEKELNLLNAISFDERQEMLLTFVRDVNWKTGLQITWRDMSFFRRLKMACSGINQLTKPLRLGLENYVGSLDHAIEKTTNEAIDQLARAARGHSFAAMTKLSLTGVADVIDKENPFLLLLIDEDTYNQLVKMEPRVGELFEDLYIFFSIRSVRMDPAYNKNTLDLIRIAKIGQGDGFNTWHVMSEYAKKLMKLDRAGKLTVQDEKEIHIWKLESSMYYVKESVRVEKRAAELIANNPTYAPLVQKVKQEPKKRPSLDDKAKELIQKSSQEELKRLVRKYIVR